MNPNSIDSVTPEEWDRVHLQLMEEARLMATKSTFPKSDRPHPVAPTKDYYGTGGIVVLDVIKAKLTKEQYLGFLLGNVIKYSLRMNHKGCSKSDATKLADYSVFVKEEINNEV